MSYTKQLSILIVVQIALATLAYAYLPTYAAWMPRQQTENFDLSISQTVDVVPLTLVNEVTFDIRIVNNGPEAAGQVLFEFQPPAQVAADSTDYQFSVPVTKVADTTWLLDDPLTASGQVTVTVMGLASRPQCTVETVSIAAVSLSNDRLDANVTNNQAAQAVTLVGDSLCIYIPLLRRQPTPTPTNTPTVTPTPTAVATPTPTSTPTPREPRLLYFEDFNDDDDDEEDEDNWSRGTQQDCRLDDRDDEYSLDLIANDDDDNNADDDDDQACYGVAPDNANERYGIFQVEAFRNDGDNNYTYGLFINADIDDDNNLDEYYLFRVFPNIRSTCNGDWELYRYEVDDDDDFTLLADRTCEPRLNPNGGRNTLAIEHAYDDDLYVYINGEAVAGPITDNRPLTDDKLGVYAQQDGDELDVRFDNFAIFEPFPDNVARRHRFGTAPALSTERADSAAEKHMRQPKLPTNYKIEDRN